MNPPPAPPSPKSSRQSEHPADTTNTKPRPAQPGGAHLHTNTFTSNDAYMFTANDR